MFGFYLLVVSVFTHGSPSIEKPEFDLWQNDVQICQQWQASTEQHRTNDVKQSQFKAQQLALANYPLNQQIIDDKLAYQQKVLVVLYEQQNKTLCISHHDECGRYQLQLFTSEEGPVSPT